MKVVEVSAICGRFAINTGAKSVYFYWKEWKGGWCEVDINHLGVSAIDFWNYRQDKKVYRSIFKIKVVED